MKSRPGKGGIQPFVAGGIAVADTKISLEQAKEPSVSKEMVDAIKALPLIPARNGSVDTLPQIKKRSKSRSRSRGRGRSAPHVEKLGLATQVKVGPDLVTVDHRVVSQGSKEIVVPRPPTTVGLSQPKHSQLRMDHASETRPVIHKSGVIARACLAIAGAGSSTKNQLINVAAKKKARQMQGPVQAFVKAAAKGLSIMHADGSSSKSTQGISQGKASNL